MKTTHRLVSLGAGAAVLGAGWQTGVAAASAANDVSLVEPLDTAAVGAAPPAADPTPAPTGAPESGAAAAAEAPAAEPAPAPEPPPPAGPSGTYVGAVVATKWGDMQAAIVVDNGRIVDVKPLLVGLGDSESLSINRSAVPQLEQRVLAAQNWNVSYVSGASSTSGGMLSSIKDAMRQAGL